MESARPMRRKTRRKMGNRSEYWGLGVLPMSVEGGEQLLQWRGPQELELEDCVLDGGEVNFWAQLWRVGGAL